MKKFLAIILLAATVGSTAFGFFGRNRMGCGGCCEDTCATYAVADNCCTETVTCDTCVADTCC